MGFIGQEVGKFAGSHLGKYIGGQIGDRGFGGKGRGEDKGREIGSQIGDAVGRLVPYKRGGLVKLPPRKKTQKALLHKGEMVIPSRFVKNIPKSLKAKIASSGGRNMSGFL
jgi:hypothetical protein